MDYSSDDEYNDTQIKSADFVARIKDLFKETPSTRLLLREIDKYSGYVYSKWKPQVEQAGKSNITGSILFLLCAAAVNEEEMDGHDNVTDNIAVQNFTMLLLFHIYLGPADESKSKNTDTKHNFNNYFNSHIGKKTNLVFTRIAKWAFDAAEASITFNAMEVDDCELSTSYCWKSLIQLCNPSYLKDLDPKNRQFITKKFKAIGGRDVNSLFTKQAADVRRKLLFKLYQEFIDKAIDLKGQSKINTPRMLDNVRRTVIESDYQLAKQFGQLALPMLRRTFINDIADLDMYGGWSEFLQDTRIITSEDCDALINARSCAIREGRRQYNCRRICLTNTYLSAASVVNYSPKCTNYNCATLCSDTETGSFDFVCRCGDAHYCSSECKMKDFTYHMPVCGKYNPTAPSSAIKKSTSLKSQCFACGEENTSLYKCSRCKKTCYCSPQCQKFHWVTRHKKECFTS